MARPDKAVGSEKVSAFRKAAGMLLRIAAILVLIPVGFAVLYALAVLVGGTIRVGGSAEAVRGGTDNDLPQGTGAAAASSDEAIIFFLDNRYHVEICLPAALSPFRDDIAAVRGDPGRGGERGYFCFGWGERVFYPVTPFLEDLNPRLVLRSLFLPTPAAIRISFFAGPIGGQYVTPYRTDRETVRRLYAFIESYLEREADGRLSIIPAETVNPVYGDSLFLNARGTYTLLFTCNNWTAEALKAAGIPASLWTPLAWNVYRKEK